MKKNLKICVYAIAKNEIRFIDRWYNSVKSADYICVLDTGSTDGSFEKFKKLGIIVEQKKYDNFRFDEARNDSLKLIPNDTDICVCVDIDEFFVAGWTEKIRKAWKTSSTRARYRYTWNFNSDGSEGVVFMADKIHKYGCYKWINPVHEILSPINIKENVVDIPSIQLNHKADNEKSRKTYLPLLELSVKEDPTNDRNVHYLGREYMFYGEYDKAIETLTHHLNLPNAKWKPERSASYRYIANCFHAKKDYLNQEKNLLLAILEYNKMREPYFETALMYYEMKDFLKSAYFFEEMLKIKNRELNYISAPICWGSLPYDYLSLCYYELKDHQKAYLNAKIALTLSPNNERIKNNMELFKNLKNN